ncbi:MAG: hypothetical protein QOG87_3414 [Actinomycetota bacterium]|jgi:uncharacterized protein with NAD-binding domain and iron-sulfur cluster
MTSRPRVAVLGGGMAGLAAAWRLTSPDGPGADVTVYQRGWRLGGKAASSRGRNGRIEEHGLHVWLGYYDNAFRLMRQVYAELDRPRTDPECPILTWRDGFTPSSVIGLEDEHDGEWHDWLAAFPTNDLVPGDGVDVGGVQGLTRLLTQGTALIGQFVASLAAAPVPAAAILSTRPTSPRRAGPVATAVMDAMRAGPPDARSVARGMTFVDVMTAMLRGLAVDDIAKRGFKVIDDEDFLEWLSRHGAQPASLASPLLRAMYDLGFAYERGDRGRPRFSAAAGVELGVKMFFGYRGSLFWKVRAGLGDVAIAPLYQALRARGVRFNLLHRLESLHLDGRRIAAVSLRRQVGLRSGVEEYEPLVRVGSLPVFPSEPDLAQLDAGPELLGHDLESYWCQWPEVEPVRIEVGRDFDAVVLATSIGMVPHVCEELLAVDERWRAMVARLGTVATQAVQVWLGPDERSLGWDHPGATMAGGDLPFDTFSSTTEVLPFETWPDDDRPRTQASFCATLADGLLPEPGAEGYEAAATSVVRDGARRLLAERVRHLWPAAYGPDGFRWELIRDQYARANVDPSDRYVQALPGSDGHRLRADGSGFDNLFLAGDWIDSGLNVGSIEAAVLSGLQAGNAALGRPVTHGTTGFEPHGVGS